MSDYIIVHGIKVAQNFVPETFGRLTTIGPRFRLPIGTKGRVDAFQVCECTCGSFCIIRACHLRTRSTESCGCLHREVRLKACTTHGKSQASEYYIWSQMKTRCLKQANPGYAYYGGRGIRVCDRWLEPGTGFSNFLADMGERPSKGHTLDRINTNGNYCPENCRWATIKVQARNKRSNVLLTYQGKTQCVVDWATELNMHADAIYSRLRYGWSAERALTTSVTKRKGQA